jgi:hypothetical protein
MECLTQLFRHVFVNLSQRLLGEHVLAPGVQKYCKVSSSCKTFDGSGCEETTEAEKKKKERKIKG